jgi:phosphoglycolate phosphatase
MLIDHMKKINLFIFDFDGTLVSSGNDLANSINHTLMELHLKPLDHKEIITYVGDGVYKLIERTLGDQHKDKFNEAFYIFTKHYQQHMCDTTSLYPGAKHVLEHFKDKCKIIMTNKLHQYTLKIARHLEIDTFFDNIIGADSTAFIKPDRRILTPVLRKYDVANDKAVVIGDGVNDILLARNAGILSCAFLNGLTQKEILLDLKPDFVCDELIATTRLFY